MDKINQIRQDIENFQKDSEALTLKQERDRKKAEENLLHRMFEEEEKPSSKGAIAVITFMSVGVLFGILCGILGFIQVFKWLIEIIKGIL